MIEAIIGAGAFLIVLGLALLFVPGIIAFKRGHSYKWIILFLGIFGTTISAGILWLVALVWSLWPQDKSLADPIIGSPTGLGSRNAGDTLGAVEAGKKRGFDDERAENSTLEDPNAPAILEMRNKSEPYLNKLVSLGYRVKKSRITQRTAYWELEVISDRSTFEIKSLKELQDFANNF